MATLAPPMFAGNSVVVEPDLHDTHGGVVEHTIGHSIDDKNTPDAMQKELDDAFDRAISEIDSLSSQNSQSPPRHRFGDLSGIIASQPLAGVLREAAEPM